jgi:hypothetical protein
MNAIGTQLQPVTDSESCDECDLLQSLRSVKKSKFFIYFSSKLHLFSDKIENLIACADKEEEAGPIQARGGKKHTNKYKKMFFFLHVS